MIHFASAKKPLSGSISSLVTAIAAGLLSFPFAASAAPIALAVKAPTTQLLNCSSVEGGISFTVSESFVKGAYDHSGSILTYEGITYEIGKLSTGYDQNVGEENIATLFSVAIPNTNPAVFFTFDIPRAETSIALNANVSTSILMGTKNSQRFATRSDRRDRSLGSGFKTDP